ncbi:MAG: NADH:ubiquinone reductase (Na(+)-transporting) subunit E [Planctomycetes bacterium]|nr:NADH:ubiquinone reductase (Na(+)-transporting) subunit E [Planctomycetota bacterium]
MTESGFTEAAAIILAAIFTGNILLHYFLGMCSFLACSREISTAAGLGLAVTFVTVATAPINWLIYNCLLAPFNLTHLWLLAFITVIAGFVQVLEMVVERVSPTLYSALGIFLPLITVNCAILGASLFAIIRGYNVWQCLLYSLGAGLGWMLAIVLMAGLRRRMQYADMPAAFAGVASAMVIAAIMALAFMGLGGVIEMKLALSK